MVITKKGTREMRIEIDYDVYCGDEWVAGANSLTEARNYAQQYREDGEVEIYEVEKKISLVLRMSKKRKAQENG